MRTRLLTGVAGIVLLDAGWFWDPAAPFVPDRELAAWYAAHGTTPWLAAAALQLAAVPFLFAFATAVGDRLADGGAPARLAATAARAGRAFAGAVLAFAVAYAAVPLSVAFTSVGYPSGPVSRFAGGAEFALFTVLGALTAIWFAGSTAVAAFRTRAVPRWLGVVSVALALLMLLNPVLPMPAITLWFLVAGTGLALSRPRAAVPAPRVPGPAVPTAA